jgi:hypothetical protein
MTRAPEVKPAAGGPAPIRGKTEGAGRHAGCTCESATLGKEMLMFQGLRARKLRTQNVQWESLSDEALQNAVGGVPVPGEAQAPSASEGAMLDPSWEASPSALIRMLAWKQQRSR